MKNYDDYDEDERYWDELDTQDEETEEDDDDLLMEDSSFDTEPGVEVSREIDPEGNEVWYAHDARVPGSTSIGHSLEEAVGGIEERRRLYREMLKKSREGRADSSIDDLDH